MNPLRTAKIVGFFSLPSAALAEHNPNAYMMAMREAPAGAGACSHCGMGILHHVVIKDAEGVTRFIGTTCAEKVGISPEALRYRLTSEQLEQRQAQRAARAANWNAREEAWNDVFEAALAARKEEVGDIARILDGEGSEFHDSLRDQILRGALSMRQAHCVCKATSATGRRNKKNGEAWDTLYDRCVADPVHPFPSYYDFCREWKLSHPEA